MPFRERFDCLWCGRAYATRTPGDLEGWASLCPACVGRAGDNGFLRARVRAALAERSRSTGPTATAEAIAAPTSPRGTDEDASEDAFYRRTGRFSQGPIQDGAWLMELDAVTSWLDGLELGPIIVELGAGSGWWSPLLAAKGELWVLDTSDDALERVRRRLVAHGLRAHLHRRDPGADPDRAADAVFAALALGSAPDARSRDRRLGAVARWLRPGGAFVFVEAASAGSSTGPSTVGSVPIPGPDGDLEPMDADGVGAALERHGLRRVSFAAGSRALLAGTAERARPP